MQSIVLRVAKNICEYSREPRITCLRKVNCRAGYPLYRSGLSCSDPVAVMRYQGPKASGIPDLHALPSPLSVLQGNGSQLALVTNGCISGTSGDVPAVILLYPEVIDGGIVAKIQDGDMIRLDSERKTLELNVNKDELASNWFAEPDLSDN